METPGESCQWHILKTEDKNLLRLAHETGSAFLATTPASMFLTHRGLVFMESAPVIIVFTKYDRYDPSVWTKPERVEFQKEHGTLATLAAFLSEDTLRKWSKDKARRAFDQYIRSLERTLRDMNTPEPNHVKVSSIYFPLFIWIRVG